jgi:hypothetical protein
VDGKERGRRIPAVGCNERATQPAALLPRAVTGCVDFGVGPRCSRGRDRCGYRRCARALANAKIHSNATHPSISTVSQAEVRWVLQAWSPASKHSFSGSWSSRFTKKRPTRITRILTHSTARDWHALMIAPTAIKVPRKNISRSVKCRSSKT